MTCIDLQFVTDSVGGGIDEEVWTDSSRTKRSDLLNNVFPDLFFVLLFFKCLGQTCLELFRAKHLSSLGRCVLGFDILLSNFFLISTGFAVTGCSSLLFLCYALRV